jgi:ABC-type spermidine/putrescine transport system permease subunit I
VNSRPHHSRSITQAADRFQAWGRRTLLSLPLIFVAIFLVVPLGLTVMISFWERAGLKFRPAFSLASYVSLIGGARLEVLRRSLVVALEATALSLVLAYAIAYFLARKVEPATARIVLVLFTIPFLINYIVRNVSYTVLLGRTGVVNTALMSAGITDAPLDWLLYSDFAVLLGLISAYMPFMIFPLFLSIGAIDRQFIEASALLGASPFTTFRTITLPLSLPGVFAAGLFGLVGCLGESAVPIILGGVGYELIGNTITSSMDVLNYPLAAALSSIVILLMLLLMLGWYLVFDMRSFLGRILEWRA